MLVTTMTTISIGGIDSKLARTKRPEGVALTNQNTAMYVVNGIVPIRVEVTIECGIMNREAAFECKNSIA
jgi:hypothetical protein